MKLLAISDLHGDADLARFAANTGSEEQVDAVLIAGDLSMMGREFTGVIAPFTELSVPIMLIGGNHDDNERVRRLAETYDAIHLDGYGVIIDGVGFIGTRGVTIGTSRQSEEEITEALERAARYAQAETLVSMTHGHPAGIPMGSLSSFVHPSKTIESVIRTLEPTVHLCGHLHEGAGLVERIGKTHVVNTAMTPMIIGM